MMSCFLMGNFWGKIIAAMILAGLSFVAVSRADDKITEYGSDKASESCLIGILYDCKQNQKLEPMQMGPKEYDRLVNEFISKNWDEAVLNRYYRVSRPMYTTQVFIPLSPAKRAPQAFNVEKIVAPSFWMIHYKGQVSPPSSGRWRFWGYGSEVCSVAVNGKTVLLSNWIQSKTLRPIPIPDFSWTTSAPPGRPVHWGLLTAGTWMDLKAGEIIDLDVLIGERAGGSFCSVLYIEKEGDKYGMQDGFPVFPIFQLAPYQTPGAEGRHKVPPFARNGPIWKAFQ